MGKKKQQVFNEHCNFYVDRLRILQKCHFFWSWWLLMLLFGCCCVFPETFRTVASITSISLINEDQLQAKPTNDSMNLRLPRAPWRLTCCWAWLKSWDAWKRSWLCVKKNGDFFCLISDFFGWMRNWLVFLVFFLTFSATAWQIDGDMIYANEIYIQRSCLKMLFFSWRIG